MAKEPTSYQLGEHIGGLTVAIQNLTKSVETLFKKVDDLDKRISTSDITTAKLSTRQHLAYGIFTILLGGAGAAIFNSIFK
jgi:hypothetical protein